MKILFSLVSLALGIVIGIVFSDVVKEDKVQFVDREVIKTVEKEVPFEIEKIVFKEKKCASKAKLCAEYISKIKELESELLASDEVTQPIAQLNKPELLTGKKNRVNLLIGFGRVGNEVITNGSNITIKEKKDLIYGLQYERKFNHNYSGTIQVQTDSKIMFGAGYEY